MRKKGDSLHRGRGRGPSIGSDLNRIGGFFVDGVEKRYLVFRRGRIRSEGKKGGGKKGGLPS